MKDETAAGMPDENKSQSRFSLLLYPLILLFPGSHFIVILLKFPITQELWFLIELIGYIAWAVFLISYVLITDGSKKSTIQERTEDDKYSIPFTKRENLFLGVFGIFAIIFSLLSHMPDSFYPFSDQDIQLFSFLHSNAMLILLITTPFILLRNSARSTNAMVKDMVKDMGS